MGQGAKSVIIWAMRGRKDDDIWLLNADRGTSFKMIHKFRETLKRIGWRWYGIREANKTDDEA